MYAKTLFWPVVQSCQLSLSALIGHLNKGSKGKLAKILLYFSKTGASRSKCSFKVKGQAVNGGTLVACQLKNRHKIRTRYYKNGILSKSKVKVVPYTFVRRGVPVREDTYLVPSACGVGSPVPLLAALFPLGTHLLLGEQWASIRSGHRVGLES